MHKHFWGLALIITGRHCNSIPINVSTLVYGLSESVIVFLCLMTVCEVYVHILALKETVLFCDLLQEGGVTKGKDEVRKIVGTSQPSLNSKIHLVFGEAGI